MLVLRSIRLRLTLWYVLLLAAILAAFSAGIYFTLRHNLYQGLDDSLGNRANLLVDVVQYADGAPTLAGVVSSNDPNQGESFVRVFAASGRLTFDNSAAAGVVPVDPRAVESALAGKTITRSVDVGEAFRVQTLPIERDGRISGVLEVGLSQGDVSDTLQSLLFIVGIAYPLTLVVASFGGVFLAGRALSPIDNLTRLARYISAEDLGQRLNLRLPDDEVGRLARTFDEMIARLDDAFRRQRQFTADASHELRTPLTAIKGQIDVALQRQRDPAAYRQVLQVVNEEVDRMIRLVGSLLTLARADAGQIPLAFEAVSLPDVVGAAVEQVRPVAGERGIELQLVSSPAVTLRADEDLLLQLLLNLLDNAIKYTPAGGQVIVGWNVGAVQVELWVRDAGIGIASEHLPHLFDRFYRVDKARSRAEGGAGLGLAISRWIAEAHGGSISVESAPGEGSTFTVTLPIDNRERGPPLPHASSSLHLATPEWPGMYDRKEDVTHESIRCYAGWPGSGHRVARCMRRGRC
ncbi:MAG: ATP-binding protein [Bacillota bacterium]|nr:ATP-binding protein [Bacillota bacterium]